MNNILTNSISERIKNGEGQYLDFKHCINDTKKIARSLVAFANTSGGSLLIGVRDNKTIAGIQSEEEYYMIETAALLYTSPVVKFQHLIHTINNKQILEIIIEQSSFFPHKALTENGEKKVYIRVDDNNFIADKIYIDAHKKKRNYNFNSKIIYDNTIKLLLLDIENNGYTTKLNFIKKTQIKANKAHAIIVNLIAMGAIDMKLTEKGTILMKKNE